MRDLEPLRGIQLERLDCSRNLITDLDPLGGISFSWLMISHNPIKSLEPLRNANVRDLRISHTQVEDLEPLRGTPLHALDCSYTPVKNLEPLRGMKLSFLDISHTRVEALDAVLRSDLVSLRCNGIRFKDWSVVREFPKLRELSCANCGLDNLEWVKGCRLGVLSCFGNQIADLEPLRGMPMHELNCSRNPITNLAPLQGMQLEQFDAGFTQANDISPLYGMPLKRVNFQDAKVLDFSPLRNATLDSAVLSGIPLAQAKGLADLQSKSYWLDWTGPVREGAFDFSKCDFVQISGNCFDELDAFDSMPIRHFGIYRTGISDLSPIRKCPMERLYCEESRISDLSGLKTLSLRELSCKGNGIVSLEPLRDMHLRLLDCSNNPISTLAPLHAQPPPLFIYETPSLPDSEILAARNAWAKKSRWGRLVKEADVVLNLRKRDVPALKKLAEEFGGHRYLHVPIPKTWMEAKRLCEELGGHLATFTSIDELTAVKRLMRTHRHIAWIGLSRQNGYLAWVTGENYSFENHANSVGFGESGPRYIYEDGYNDAGWGTFFDQVDRTLCFIIEWDE